MADNGKVVINLMTGYEDADKVTVARPSASHWVPNLISVPNWAA